MIPNTTQEKRKDLFSPRCILLIGTTCKSFAVFFNGTCTFYDLSIIFHCLPFSCKLLAILHSTKTFSSMNTTSSYIARPSIPIKSCKLKLWYMDTFEASSVLFNSNHVPKRHECSPSLQLSKIHKFHF